MKSISLICVDTRDPRIAAHALNKSLSHMSFARAIFFTSDQHASTASDLTNAEVIIIPDIKTVPEYSKFILRDLTRYITTEHVLINQWDGFIRNPALWDPEFLNYDYIGAPWERKGIYKSVGNGGFSLRSKRLMDALQKLDFDATQPEDDVICKILRSKLERDHGIRYSPIDLAKKFSHEYGDHQDSFGFHGMHNFCEFMTLSEIMQWLSFAPEEILASKHTRRLIKRLIELNRGNDARAVLFARAVATGKNLDHLLLLVKSHL